MSVETVLAVVADPIFLLAGGLALIGLVMLVLSRRPNVEKDSVAETVYRLAENQAELAGRMAQFAEQAATGQSSVNERLQAQERAITKTLDERLADMSRRVGESLHRQSTQNEHTMGDLKERLAAINVAQDRITQLSEQVVTLQDVLTNKQARGGFGETQLADQVKAALPPSAYQFQATLSNKCRVDCLLTLPNPPGSIGVDSKFPLESFHLIRSTPDGEERQKARKAFGRAVLRHVHDIAEKYILPGETSDCALMFLPSEAVYAELHAELPDVVEKSHNARVYIVSPTTLMALLNTIRAVLKDTQMREQAGLIQREVRAMNKDVERLDERVEKLKRHFDLSNDAIREIRISTDKVTRRAEKIEAVEIQEPEAIDAAASTGSGGTQSASPGSDPAIPAAAE